MDTTKAPSYDELVEENRQLRAEVALLRGEIVSLREQVAKLMAELERLQREGKRQAAPFRKQEEPKGAAKKPGRKRGRRHGPHAHRGLPPRIDETHDAPLPPQCPHCHGSRLRETHVVAQYQTEIPRQAIYRQFDVHVGTCLVCGRSVQGRHPLQTSSGQGAAASQFGPRVHAVLAILNKQLGLSHGKSVKLLRALFEGLIVARATSVRSIQRTSARTEPAYEQVGHDVRGSPQIVADETGWRVGGRNAWLHAFVGKRETYYEIDPTRSGKPAERLLGKDWAGTLVHDGWSPYDQFGQAAHQQCLRHLQRRCLELLATAEGAAVRFPRNVLTLIDRAFALRRAWRGHRLTGDDLAEQGLSLACQLEQLASGRFRDPANRRLARHLGKHALHWFWFLLDPTIDATNYRGEQALRPAVVNRKVWGGNRTWIGAKSQSILTSILRTCEQRAHDALNFFVQALCQTTPQLIPA